MKITVLEFLAVNRLHNLTADEVCALDKVCLLNAVEVYRELLRLEGLVFVKTVATRYGSFAYQITPVGLKEVESD